MGLIDDLKRKLTGQPAPKPAPVQTPAPTPRSTASRVFDQVNPFDSGRTFKQAVPTKPQASVMQQATHNGLTNLGGSIAKPLIRSGIAINQGIGNAEVGIAHALGKAQNVKTQNAQQFVNQSIGNNLNKAIDYKGTKRQIVGDAVSNVANVGLPGSSKLAGAAVTKVLPKAAPRIVQTLAPKIIGNAAAGATGGAFGNVGGLIASNERITPQNLLKTAGTGAAYGAAIGGALPIAAPVAKVAGKATVKGAKIADREIRTSYDKRGVVANYDATLTDLNKQRAALQQRIQGTSNFRGVETTQRHIDDLDHQIAQTTANRPKLSVKDRILAPNVGLSMRAVHSPDLTPEQNNFIEQYAEMLKSTGQGNGVDILPNGTRVSNNMRSAEEKGKQLTNGHWFDKARKEIESGKGAYGASDEYKALHQTETPLEIPAGFEASAPQAKPPQSLDELFNDPANNGLFNDTPVTPPANAFQDTLPSGKRPASVREVVKNGGNPLYHDTDAKAVLGILDSGELRPSQAPFSSIAGQGKRVSTTRNFDNYSRYGKAPYRFVIDERKTGQKSIPDNREEFESIFNKPVKTNSVASLAIDTTNPAILDDINNGKLVSVIAKAKEKGIKIETFEGKILPDEAANKEIQALTKQKVNETINSVSAPKTMPVRRLPGEAVPPQLPIARETGSVSLPDNTRQRGFVTSVKKSDEVSDPTKTETNGSYQVRNTDALANRAQQAVDNNPAARETVQKALDKKTGTINDDDVAQSITLAKKLDGEGNSREASDVYEKLAEHLTKQGQSVQAASLLTKRSPEGLKFGAEKALRKGNVPITDQLRTKMDSALREVKKYEIGSPERDYAVARYQKLISDALPSDFADKASSIWKAGLLTGIKTQTGNALSNGTFGVLHSASDPLAAMIDKAISLRTGVRTKTATLAGRGTGLTEGVKKGGQFFKTGIDERNITGNKFDQGEVNFGDGVLGKAAKTYVNTVFRAMGAADRPAYYSQLRNSLQDLGRAEAKTKGLGGTDAQKYVQNFAKEPPKAALQTATDEAEKAVLGNDTFLGTVAGKIRQAGNSLENPLARNTANLATNVLIPFTKVPSAFISRVIDYTPVGAVKEAAQQIASKKLDQRALSTALSEATTGSAVIYLGAELANNGLLSGDYPDDPKEQARWKAEGIQPNSVHFGKTWVSLNYFGPSGSLFNQGKRLVDSLNEGNSKAGAATNAVGGIASDALNQSFLQGVSGAVDAVQDPKRYAQNFTKQQAGSVVPTLVNDVAVASDKSQRQADTPTDTIKSRLPGQRQSLKPAQDVYGNPLARKTGAVSTAVNPFRPSDDVSNSVKSEVARLHKVNPNDKDLQVTPTNIDKAIKVEGSTVKLTNDQRYSLQKQVGQATQTNWDKLIKTSEYKALDDAGKARALSNLRTDTTSVSQRNYMVDNNLATYEKAMTKRQIALSEGTSDLADYARSQDKAEAITIASTTKKSTNKVTTAKKASSGSGSKTRAANLPKSINYSSTAKISNIGGLKLSSVAGKVKKGKVALRSTKA